MPRRRDDDGKFLQANSADPLSDKRIWDFRNASAVAYHSNVVAGYFADKVTGAGVDAVFFDEGDSFACQYLLRSIFMSTWGFLPAVFRPLRTVFRGRGAGFLNLTEGTAKKRGKNGKKWARNGLKRVGVS